MTTSGRSSVYVNGFIDFWLLLYNLKLLAKIIVLYVNISCLA